MGVNLQLDKMIELIIIEVAGKGKLLSEKLMQAVFEHARAGRGDVSLMNNYYPVLLHVNAPFYKTHIVSFKNYHAKNQIWKGVGKEIGKIC